MKELLPLQNSAAYDKTEQELKDLVLLMWQKKLYDRACDINLYGMPHLGSHQLLLKELVDLGFSNFNTTKFTHDRAKYLLLAKRHNNQKRGLHLLKTFIKCTWGNSFEVYQLWQNVNKPYPTALKTQEEILSDGERLDDYFLTSRLRIELNGITERFPNDVETTVSSVLAARLFVAEIIKRLSASSTIVMWSLSKVYSYTRGSGHTQIETVNHKDNYQFYGLSKGYSITRGNN